MFQRHAICFFMASFLATFVPTANAAFFDYGDLAGPDVMYLDITEDTSTDGMLFGTPDITGNTLDFDPTSFKADSDGPTFVDSQLNFTLMSNSNDIELTDVFIRERGDFTLTGLGDAQALATVGTNVSFTITQLNGADPPDLLPTGSGIMIFTPDATPDDPGQFNLDNFGNVTTETWTGVLDLDIAAFLLAVDPLICPSCADGTAFATKIEFFIDNALTAIAADGGTAFIKKKDFNGVSITIPEPSSLTLLGMLGCLAGVFRRST